VGGARLAVGNDEFLWALDAVGAKIAGFRAVSTSTGCASGCSPVVFHMRFDYKGAPQAVVADPKHPLRKVGHALLSKAEIDRLGALARELPKGLAALARPSDAANEDEGFPAQTWTPFKPLVVEGAAYTSYRVFETALNTSEALRASFAAQRQEMSLAQDLIGTIYRTEDPAEARKLLERLGALLKDPATARPTRVVALEFAAPLTAWLALRMEMKEDEAARLVPVAAYRESRPGGLCLFYRRLLTNERGAKLLGAILKKPAAWPSCGAETDSALQWLAASRTNDVSRLRELAKTRKEIPLLALAGSDELQLFRDGARKAQAAELEKLASAELFARYPRLASAGTAAAETQEARTLRTQAEAQALEETRRLLSDPADVMPTVTGLRGKSKVTLPLKGAPRVYVLFAAWCPHCKATVSRWVRDYGAKGDFWNKIQLVEVMPDGTRLSDFCGVTRLSEEACSKVISLPAYEKATDFYERMGLSSVPRALGTDAQGRLRITDLEIPRDPNADFGVLVDRVLKVLAEAPAL
jgi:hypothetical protein